MLFFPEADETETIGVILDENCRETLTFKRLFLRQADEQIDAN